MGSHDVEWEVGSGRVTAFKISIRRCIVAWLGLGDYSHILYDTLEQRLNFHLILEITSIGRKSVI